MTRFWRGGALLNSPARAKSVSSFSHSISHPSSGTLEHRATAGTSAKLPSSSSCTPPTPLVSAVDLYRKTPLPSTQLSIKYLPKDGVLSSVLYFFIYFVTCYALLLGVDYELSGARNTYFCLLHLTSYGTLCNNVNKYPLSNDH